MVTALQLIRLFSFNNNNLYC